jgi:hypothetical protein
MSKSNRSDSIQKSEADKLQSGKRLKNRKTQHLPSSESTVVFVTGTNKKNGTERMIVESLFTNGVSKIKAKAREKPINAPIGHTDINFKGLVLDIAQFHFFSPLSTAIAP